MASASTFQAELELPVPWFVAIGDGVCAGLALLLLLYLRHQQGYALHGDVYAARQLVLPALVPILGQYVVVSLAGVAWALAARSLHAGWLQGLAAEVYFSAHQYVLLLGILVVGQPSRRQASQWRAVWLALAMAVVNVPIVGLVHEYAANDKTAYWIARCSHLVPILFLAAIVVWPPLPGNKRMVRGYCAYVALYGVADLTWRVLHYEHQGAASTVMQILASTWAACCPVLMWPLLRADTERWRTLGQRACVLQARYRQQHRTVAHVSSRGLHVLVEMQPKHVIDFAVLEFQERIGVGASADVYQGLLRMTTPVAIKVYTPEVVNEEVVAEYAHEAALCGVLHHPNIVKFYGMCVCPPSICLVSELCVASLKDVTRAHATNDHAPMRAQLLISVNYMIDAARAVAYLHSFVPAFRHRDIKPVNFLVDDRGVVKLTDLGVSRFLPGTFDAKNPPTEDTESQPSMRLRGSMTQQSPVFLGTADFMAPEQIQGKHGTGTNGDAADIFSLAMTFWDVLNPLSDKYPNAKGNHFLIIHNVVSGQRPVLDDSFPADLRWLLCEAWDPDPVRRPSAVHILNTLQQIQQELCVDSATTLSAAVDTGYVLGDDIVTPSKRSCTGAALVEKMLEYGYVESVGEALRLGNGFMSAEVLHHARHSIAFEASDERYIFDDAFISRLEAQTGRQLRSVPEFRRTDFEPEVEPCEESTTRKSLGVPGSTDMTSFTTQCSTLTPSLQWMDTNSRHACLCRRLGAGIETWSKGTAERITRIRKMSNGAQPMLEQSEEGGTTPRSTVSALEHVKISLTDFATAVNIDEEDANALTANLLMNDFSTTGDSAYGVSGSSFLEEIESSSQHG